MTQPSDANSMTDTTLELPGYGPKMASLASDKQRAFVCALFRAPVAVGQGAHLWAAQMAGYGTPESNNKVFSAIAARLLADPAVIAAIDEVSFQEVRALGPEAIMRVRELINDRGHREHGRALGMILDRIAPLQTTIRVQDERPAAIEQATEKVLAKIEEIARRYNLGAPPATIIDGECRDVTSQVPA